MGLLFSNKCRRCGQRYPASESVCPYCHGLTDQQLREIRTKRGFGNARNSDLQRVLIYLGVLLVIGLLIYELNKI